MLRIEIQNNLFFYEKRENYQILDKEKLSDYGLEEIYQISDKGKCIRFRTGENLPNFGQGEIKSFRTYFIKTSMLCK
jgi:hypothetical protein